MKIIRFSAENIKKLTAVEICPDGNVVQITGRNGAGKTSVLDALWWVFTGAENIQAQPIRHGEEKARIEVELGEAGKVELVITRTFTPTNSYLSVQTADGAKYPKPQQFMENLIGSLTLDPLAFMREKPAAQFATLRGLVKLDIDPEQMDRDSEKDREARTIINRDAKSKRAVAASIIVPEDLPDATVDESDLLDQMGRAAETNADISRRAANRLNAGKQIANSRESVTRLQADAEKLLQDAKELAESTDKLESDIKAAGELPALVDVTDLRAQLDTAKAVNAGIEARDRLQKCNVETEALEAESAALTAAIEKRTTDKLEAIAKADMPVPGLGFSDNAVTFKGLPLDQASDAEQLEVSMSIAAAFNPKLRVLRVRDGSLLDSDAMVRMAAFADKRDLQIWVEVVTDGNNGVGFVMEDGHIRGQELASVPEKPAAKPRASKTMQAAE
jgi:DNA repair exonuclease SbcCD ATPase subunit